MRETIQVTFEYEITYGTPQARRTAVERAQEGHADIFGAGPDGSYSAKRLKCAKVEEDRTMAQCKRCGANCSDQMRLCYTCSREWQLRRNQAFALAIAELGKPNESNIAAIRHRVNEIDGLQDVYDDQMARDAVEGDGYDTGDMDTQELIGGNS